MRQRLSVILLSMVLSPGMGQTIENIRVEPRGDYIMVHYRIGGSTDEEIYDVTLSCSMDGGPRFEPESVVGDVGKNIRGGKSTYTITWDVFEDLEMIGEAEFFVKVDRAGTKGTGVFKDLEPDLESPERGEEQGTPYRYGTHIGFNGSTYSPYGLSAGSLKDYGFFGSIRSGTNNDEFQTDIWVTLVAGFTIHAFTRGIYRMHGYGGIGSGRGDRQRGGTHERHRRTRFR